MKWRIVLTILFVLVLFTGFAYLYVNTFVRKHQHAVILFVVNGLDLNLLDQARHDLGRSSLLGDPDDPAIGDARRRAAYRNEILNVDSLWNVALLGIQDPGKPVPDEGADATALACGARVDNGYVAINNSNEALRSLIYAAEQARRATGLITTSSVVEPTPVAFYSTINGTPDPYRNANDLLYSGIDIILGGGEQYFIPANAGNELGRRDGRNLIDEAKARGYSIVYNRDDLNNVSTWRTRQLFGLFAPGPFYFSSLQPANRRQPSLAEMTRTAISSLNYNIDGYFLVIEHNLVARAAGRNLGKIAVSEVAQVDEAIQSAVEYAGPDALVIVTNNYSLGSIAPLAEPTAGDLIASPPAVDDRGLPVRLPPIPMAPPPQPAWLAGPGGPTFSHAQAAWLRQREADGSFTTNAPAGLLQPQPALRFQTQARPLAEPAWLASRGEGSVQLRGFINNTDVFDIVSEQF
ncbi:MAG: alkaline phosphatase [Methylacidiphilales bacterium]|nr:alkaline phosphatase [Candidatus Methylacidiphilales bacterium]